MRAIVPSAILLAWISLAGPLASEEQAFSARRIVEEAKKAAAGLEEPNWLINLHLAKAQAYLGDLPAAWATIGPLKPEEEIDDWIWSAYVSCAEIEIKRTGKHTPLPKEIHDHEPDLTRLYLAEAYAQRGDARQALELLEQLPERSLAAREISNKVVPALLVGGQRDLARSALAIQEKSYERVNALLSPRSGVDRLIQQLVKIGDQKGAIEFCRKWEVKLNEADLQDWGRYVSQSWANLGRAFAMVGDKPAGTRAIQRAYDLLAEASDIAKAKADARKIENEEVSLLMDAAESLAFIASRQRLVEGEQAATGNLHRAFDLADQVVPSKFGYYAYEQIVACHLENDDLDGALAAIPRILSSRTRAKAWHKVAEHHLTGKRETEALTALRRASESLDKELLRAEDAELCGRIAKSFAVAGDLMAADREFVRAVRCSALQHSEYHSWIARFQAEAGRFADSYATLRSDPDATHRTYALSVLACEMAKSESK